MKASSLASQTSFRKDDSSTDSSKKGIKKAETERQTEQQATGEASGVDDVPCTNQLSGENASVALHGESQSTNDVYERLDILKARAIRLEAELAFGVVEVPSTNQLPRLWSSIGEHASVALHGESQPSNDPGDKPLNFHERFHQLIMYTYDRISRVGTLDNLEGIPDDEPASLLKVAYKDIGQIRDFYVERLKHCVQANESDDLDVLLDFCAGLYKTLAVIDSMKRRDPLPGNKSEDLDEDFNLIAEEFYADAQEVRSRRCDKLRRVQASGVMRGPSPDRLAPSPTSPTTNAIVEEADDGPASPPQEPQRTGSLNRKRATTILPRKVPKSKMSFDVFNWGKKRTTELTISGPVGPVIHTGYAAHPLQRTTELSIPSPIGPVGHACFASHVLERVEPPTPDLDSAEGVSSPATTSADAANMEETITNPQQQANEDNDRRQSLNTETTNLKTGEKFPSLKKSKSMFLDAKQAVTRVFSSIAWKFAKMKATEEDTEEEIGPLDKSPLDPDDPNRLSRRMAEGDNFCNPKAQYLSGNGHVPRKPLPASMSAEYLWPVTPDDPSLETRGMEGHLSSPYSQSSPHIDLTPHENMQADARIDSSPPSPMPNPPRTVSGEMEDHVDSSYSQSNPDIDLTPYKNKQASTRNDGSSPPPMPKLPRTVCGEMEDHIDSSYSQSSTDIDLTPYKNKQASTRNDGSSPPSMPKLPRTVSGEMEDHVDSSYSQSSPDIDLTPYKNKQASARIDSSPPPPMPQFSSAISGLAQHPHVMIFARPPLGSSTPRNHLEPQTGTDGEEILADITNGQPFRTSLLSTNNDGDNSYMGIGEALTTDQPVVLPTAPHGILARSANQSFIPKPVKTDSMCSERKINSTSPYRFKSGDEDEPHMD